MTQESRGNKKGVVWWWIQRFTALILLVLIGRVGVWLATTGPITHETYTAFLNSWSVLVLGVLSALAVVLHSIYGMWGVLTDYMNRHTGGRLGYALWPYVFGLFILLGMVSLIWMLKLLTGI